MIEDAILIADLGDLITVPVNKNAKIVYRYVWYTVITSKLPGKTSFFSIASEIRIMTDVAAHVPRTAYMGVVSVMFQGIRLFIVPEDGPSFTYSIL